MANRLGLGAAHRLLLLQGATGLRQVATGLQRRRATVNDASVVGRLVELYGGRAVIVFAGERR
jgi:hypothetical protein